MKMTTGRLLLEDPSNGRISTTCNQRVRAHNLTKCHYILLYREIN
jgi:hypothetical protein